MDILARAEQIARRKIAEIVRERMRWPNPNPDGELEDAWDAYEEAYERWWCGLPTPTGLDAADEYRWAWERLCDAVMKEYCEAVY